MIPRRPCLCFAPGYFPNSSSKTFLRRLNVVLHAGGHLGGVDESGISGASPS